MEAATIDLDINEGETFIMVAEFWEDQDNTIPTDISSWVFEGMFKIGTKLIPMTMSITTPNFMEATVDYQDMTELGSQGRYDIEALQGTEKFRLFQGAVRVSQEVA